MNNILLYLVVSVPFCLIAGLVAGLIVYEEFRHHFIDKKKSIKPAIETAVVAFFFFLIIVFVVVNLLTR
ncbi:MAG: hypothetical protein N2114_03550 [Candidatus Goldbacteria bacterium]|nr:hypothetical protein [Candidatus Goldiibacteriota bacterium]